VFNHAKPNTNVVHVVCPVNKRHYTVYVGHAVAKLV